MASIIQNRKTLETDNLNECEIQKQIHFWFFFEPFLNTVLNTQPSSQWKRS